MKQRLNPIRGAIGIALTWAFAWVLAAAVLARLPGVDSDLPLPYIFAPLGFATGAIFSGLLIATERRRPFDQLSVARFAMWGAVSGLLLASVITAAAALRGENWPAEFRLFGPPLVLGSAVSAAGLLTLARSTQRWRRLVGYLRMDVLMMPTGTASRQKI